MGGYLPENQRGKLCLMTISGVNVGVLTQYFVESHRLAVAMVWQGY